MAIKHTMLAIIPIGDLEVGVKIAFNFTKGSPDYWNPTGGHWEQGWGPEIEFLSAEPYKDGKSTAATFSAEAFNRLASNWLESERGQQEAVDAVEDRDNE